MNVLRWLDEWAEEVVVSAMLATLVLFLGLTVIGRFILSKSFPWSEEFCRYLFVWSSYLGVAIAVKRKEQLRILMLMDLLAVRYPGLVRVLYIISELIFTGFCVAVFYFSIGLMQNMMQYKQVSASLEINMIYPYSIIPISMALTAFRTLQGLYRDFKRGTLYFTSRGD